ncbi:MAG: FtsX-like permease family protein [Dehalococcoidia bacterium]|nr:FtsX-like permease family protein [Dehalococcoidia bacterium]
MLRRSMAGRGLLAVMALGVIVAATLLASAPIYARTMADLGLTFVIRDELSDSPGSSIEFPGIALNTPEGRALRAAVEQRIDERWGWFRGSQSRYLKLGRWRIAKPGDPERGLVGQPQSMTGYEEHVKVISGRLPRTTAAGEPLEVAVSQRGLQASQLKIGDALEMREIFDSCEREMPTQDPPPPPPPCNAWAEVRFSFGAVIVGTIEPANDRDPFWMGYTPRYFEPARLPLVDQGVVVPMFANEASLLEGLGSRVPAYSAATQWHVFADPSTLTRTNFGRAKEDLAAFYGEMEPLGGVSISPLKDTLGGFGESASYQQIPLTILLLEITGIALFYVGLVAAIVVERQAAEIALLRGRGASLLQVGTVYLFQGLLIGLPAMVLAPFLAAATTALLGLLPTFRDVSGGDLLPVTIPPLSFAAAGGGAALSLVALLAPAMLVARKSATAVGRAESRPGKGLFQRYYLDLALAGVAVALLFELRQRGSVFTPSSTGGVSTDPILLASPALTIAAGGALVIRFYPLLLRVVARLTRGVSGATVALGLTQVVRNPGQYTRLTLLVMMAVAVGTFAASYTSTTDRSYRERAYYSVGAEVRATASDPFDVSANEAEQTLSALPGVDRASAVMRTRAQMGTTGAGGAEFQLLAVDPTAARDMLWFRDDFAEVPFRELTGAIAGQPAQIGRSLPGTPATISAWVKGDQTHASITIWARIRDGKGLYQLVELGNGDTGKQWKQLSGAVAARFGSEPVAPFTLVAILFTEPSNRPNQPFSPMLIDDVTVDPGNGQVGAVEEFEQGGHWAVFPSRAANQDAFALVPDDAHGGKSTGRFTFRPGSTSEVRGLYATGQSLPLPAVVSQSLLDVTGLRPGGHALVMMSGSGQNILAPIVVAGVFDLFPTTESDAGPVVVMNRDQLAAWAEIASFGGVGLVRPNEAWFTLERGAGQAAIDTIIATLAEQPFEARRVLSREASVKATERNPLIAAGGSGILLVAFLAVLALVGAALLTSLLTSVRRRRVEFAVQRAMGLSRPQVFQMLALEYSVVAVAGVVTGAVLGLIVGRQMLSFLDATEDGARVEPSFILQTEWTVVAGAVGVVGLIFLGALLAATRYLATTSDAAALHTE